MTAPGARYREHAPPPALAGQLVCSWTQVIGAGDGPLHHRVLPDGCADLVWIGDAPPVVAGPATRTMVVPLAPGSVVVGLRLRPGMLPAVLGPPARDLVDRDTPLAAIWGERACAGAARVAERSPAAGRLQAAEAALAPRLAAAAGPDPAIGAATRWLARHPAGRIEALARHLEIGERQLHRRFVAAIGYGPKTFQRILRLQRALLLAGREGPAGLAAVAAAAGYADQAHMSRELQALAGQSAATLLRTAASTLEMSDLFKTAPGRQP